MNDEINDKSPLSNDSPSPFEEVVEEEGGGKSNKVLYGCLGCLGAFLLSCCIFMGIGYFWWSAVYTPLPGENFIPVGSQNAAVLRLRPDSTPLIDFCVKVLEEVQAAGSLPPQQQQSLDQALQGDVRNMAQFFPVNMTVGHSTDSNTGEDDFVLVLGMSQGVNPVYLMSGMIIGMISQGMANQGNATGQPVQYDVQGNTVHHFPAQGAGKDGYFAIVRPELILGTKKDWVETAVSNASAGEGFKLDLSTAKDGAAKYWNYTDSDAQLSMVLDATMMGKGKGKKWTEDNVNAVAIDASLTSESTADASLKIICKDEEKAGHVWTYLAQNPDEFEKGLTGASTALTITSKLQERSDKDRTVVEIRLTFDGIDAAIAEQLAK